MMQKGGGKVDQLVLKSGDFIATVQQKLIDSTSSVEQMETKADLGSVTSAMHRKLTINNDNLLSSLDASAEPPYSADSCGSDDNKLPFHYLFLDSSILKKNLSVVGACSICSSKELEICNDISKMKGLANCLAIKCIATGCNFIYSTYTSTRVSKKNQAGQKPFDINARSIIGCCEIYHCCEKLHQ